MPPVGAEVWIGEAAIGFPFSTPHLFVSVTWVPTQEKDIQNACVM